MSGIEKKASPYLEHLHSNIEDGNWSYLEDIVSECIQEDGTYNEDILKAYLEANGYKFVKDFDSIEEFDEYVQEYDYIEHFNAKTATMSYTQNKVLLILIGNEYPEIH